MGTIRLRMTQKEITEGYRAQIPGNIMSKMIQGLEISKTEKEIVNSKGKSYVLGHTKEKGRTRIKPQLRNLHGGKLKSLSRRFMSIEDKKRGVKRVIDEYNELERLKVDPEARITDKNVAVGEIEGMKVMLQTFGLIESVNRTGRKELENLYNRLEQEEK